MKRARRPLRPLADVSAQDYLKAIFHLQGDTTARVKTKELAQTLRISLPSVTGMLKSLASDGLVDYASYRGVRLSAAGRKRAMRVIRNHRLIESFLVEALDFSWDEVHAEAEVLEHAVSDALVDRIDRYLEHPAFDPHGDPIPTPQGTMVRRAGTTLLAANPKRPHRVVRVLDQAPEVLRYLQQLGLELGTILSVDQVRPHDGPLVIKLGSNRRSISRALASRLIVAPVVDKRRRT